MGNRFTDTGNYTKAEVETIFGPKSNGKIANELHRDHPEIYRAVRAQAVAMGIVGAESYVTPEDLARFTSGPRQFTENELRVRQMYSETEVRELFGGNGNPGNRQNAGKLHAEDPQKYADMKAAAISYGILPASSATKPAPVRPVKAAEPSTFPLEDSIADRANLPRGTRVTLDQFSTVMRNIAEHEQREKAAAENAAAVKGE
jgi:hypothetical protein